MYKREVDSLVTPSLVLRPFVLDDAPAMHRIYSDPVVMRYVATGPAANLAATERLLNDYAVHQRGHGFSFWGVREHASLSRAARGIHGCTTSVGPTMLQRTPSAARSRA